MNINIKKKFLLTFFILIISSKLIAYSISIHNANDTKNTYIAKYIPSNQKIIRVEITVQDNISTDYYDIIEVFFNNKKINLSKADASGNRARKYFQLKPGIYSIKWKISKAKATKWPNYEEFKKTIVLKEYNPYVHIAINGNEIKID